MKIKKICPTCKTYFYLPDSKKGNKRKYCSPECYRANDSFRGRTPWNKGTVGLLKANKNSYKKGMTPWNKGLHPEYVQGENHPMWSGQNIGYTHLHKWVVRQLGRPKECEHCHIIKERLHWANVSGEYKRDTADWIRLCASCHAKYDKNRGWGKIRSKYPHNVKTQNIRTHWVLSECLNCGKQFKKPLCRIKAGRGKYCSRYCLNKNKKKYFGVPAKVVKYYEHSN